MIFIGDLFYYSNFVPYECDCYHRLEKCIWQVILLDLSGDNLAYIKVNESYMFNPNQLAYVK